MRSRKGGIIVVLLLAAAVSVSVHLKVRAFRSSSFYTPDDPTLLFRSESAVHYLYARLVAEGGRIPDFDPRIQAPEGIRVKESFTTLMESMTGKAFRIFRLTGRDVELHVFLVYFLSLFGALSVIACYLAGRSIWGSPASGVLSSLAFVFSIPAFYRYMGGFLREYIALPLLFVGLALGWRYLERGKKVVLLLSTLSLFLALVSWHLTQFTFIIMVLFFLARSYSGRITDREAHVTLAIYLAFAVAGIMVPPLRSKHFLFSPLFLLWSGLVISLAFTGADASRKRFFWISGCGLLLLAGVVQLLFLRHFTEFSHVYLTLFYKLRFLGVKPVDPASIPYTVRIFWAGPFLSPSLHYMVYQYAGPLILLAMALWHDRTILRRGAFRPPGKLLLYTLLLAFFALFLFFSRISAFFVFFLSVAAGGLLRGRNVARRVAACTLGALVLAGMAWVSLDFPGKGNPWSRATAGLRPESDPPFMVRKKTRMDLLNWIRHNTLEDDIVVADFSFSPTIYLETGRSIALHSMFELKDARDKVEEFLKAMYGREEDLYRFCRHNRASYLVFDIFSCLNQGTSSGLYISGQPIITTDHPAFLMAFRPERLEHFCLLYQNDTYRVFRVAEDVSSGEIPCSAARLPYQSSFDIELFRGGEEAAEVLDRRKVNDFLRTRHEAGTRFPAGIEYFRSNRYERARQVLEPLLGVYPSDLHLVSILGDVYAGLGDMEKGTGFFTRLIGLNPSGTRGYLKRGILRFEGGDFRGAREDLERARELDPDGFRAHSILGLSCIRTGDHRRAEDVLKEGLIRTANRDEVAQIKELLETMTGPDGM